MWIYRKWPNYIVKDLICKQYDLEEKEGEKEENS